MAKEISGILHIRDGENVDDSGHRALSSRPTQHNTASLTHTV